MAESPVDTAKRVKDIRRMLSDDELRDIRAREDRDGTSYSDRDMLLDHIELASVPARSPDALTEALRAISTRGLHQHIDWMHFHEEAISDPFHAETLAQGFAAKIHQLAEDALTAAGLPPTFKTEPARSTGDGGEQG